MRRRRTVAMIALIGGGAAIGLAPALAGAFSTSTAGSAAMGGIADDHGTLYELDPVHSSVVFSIKHLNVTNVYGRFNEMGGTFRYDGDNPENSMFELEIRTRSIDTNNGDRDNHLRSPDFFNARQYPTATFKSSSVSRKSEGVYEVEGELTIHGQTREVTVEMQHTGSNTVERFGHRRGFEAHFTIDRHDFEVSYMPEMLGSDVHIIVALQGIGQD